MIQKSSFNKENNDKVYKSQKTILGFSVPVFLMIVLIFILQIILSDEKKWHNWMTSLTLAMLSAAILKMIGSNVPILKDIGGPSILCILVPSIFLSFDFFGSLNLQTFGGITKQTIRDKMNFLNKGSNGIGFSSFFVSSLIAGSFFSMDSKLLKQSFKRFFPLVVISLFVVALITSLFGFFLTYLGHKPIGGIRGFDNSSKNGFLDTFYYIVAPLASGGMTAGIIPLGLAYSETLGTSKTQSVNSHIIPALLIGGIFSIFCAGIIKKVFRNTRYDGHGQLLKNKISSLKNNKTISKISQKKISSEISYQNINTGLVSIFTIYSLSIVIRTLIVYVVPKYYQKCIPDVIVFVVLVTIFLKLLNFINNYYKDCINQASKLITTNFTSALLVILGCTLNFKDAYEYVTLPFVATCCVSVITVALTTAFIGEALNFYALESSVTAGLCLNCIGGAGNINILTAADLMELIPYAQISTRIGGALVVVVSSLTYPLIYGGM